MEERRDDLREAGEVREAAKYCPMNGMDCDARCAWRLGTACAAAVLGREAYALVEAYMAVNGVLPVADADGAEDGEQ